MKLIKVMNGKEFEVELEDINARKMLEKHPGVYKLPEVAEEPAKRGRKPKDEE